MKNTLLMFRDELRGFALSWVMIGLWVGLPLVSVLMFFLLPTGYNIETMPGIKLSMTFFIGLLISSLGGTLAAVMLSVDVVNEKNRKVYDLYVIRPIKPGNILLAKFFAVLICVSVACGLALVAGMLVDMVRGVELGELALKGALDAFVDCVGVVALSASGGVAVGAIAPSVLISVLLVLYGTQQLAALPVMPGYLGIDHISWLFDLITLGITIFFVWGAMKIFNKKEF